MNTVVDIIIIIFLALGILAGLKRGLIKSLVSFVGLITVIIISYALKTPLANFMIDKMPFFQISGGLTSLNILIYNVIAFIAVFVLLYCILNVIISVTKFIDTLLKFTVIWIIPSKIGGAIVGFLEAWLYVFVVLFLLVQFNFTGSFIKDSKVANIVLDKTPVVGKYFKDMSRAAKDINDIISEYSEKGVTTENIDELNLRILQIEINYGLVTKEKGNELMQTGKIPLKNVLLGSEELKKWLNI